MTANAPGLLLQVEVDVFILPAVSGGNSYFGRGYFSIGFFGVYA